MKLWGGRFGEENDARVADFTRSVAGGVVPPRLPNAVGTPDKAWMSQARPDPHGRRDAASNPKPRRRRGGRRKELRVVAHQTHRTLDGEDHRP